MAHHYESLAAYELFGDPARLRQAPPSPHAGWFLSLIRDIGLTPGKAYEIGCASGEMLNQFRNQGWQVGGCDPSPSATAQAAAIFGIAADLGGEETALGRQKNLDLVLMCHVLEHLYDPPATLTRINRALAAGGHLMLEVPCATAPEILPPGWFTFEHLHYYRPEILERLLREAGFEIAEMRIAMRAEHYPVISVAARKAQAIAGREHSDPTAARAMAHAYAARDAALWDSTRRRLAEVSGAAFIYGAGIHTAQLLDRTDLANGSCIADRRSRFQEWGQNLAGNTVISPDDLFAHSQQPPVIISSYVSERAIMRALIEAGVAPARIVPLSRPPPRPNDGAAAQRFCDIPPQSGVFVDRGKPARPGGARLLWAAAGAGRTPGPHRHRGHRLYAAGDPRLRTAMAGKTGAADP